METGNGSGVNAFERALLAVDRLHAEKCLAGRVEEAGALAAVDTLIVPALRSIGNRWEAGELALSQVYMSGRICEQLVDAHLPRARGTRENTPRMAAAVLEDHHLLGKRIVCSVLRAAGYDVRDYGHGLGVDALLRKVSEDGTEILLLSVLMLRSALRIKELVTALRESGLRTRVVAGGAPFLFDGELCRESNVDACGTNAADALEIVSRLSTELGYEVVS